MNRILFICNGHGEDAVVVNIMRALREIEPRLKTTALPLVGSGKSFSEAEFPFIASQNPSGGGPTTWKLIKHYVRGNFLTLTPDQHQILPDLSRHFDLAIAVGDSIPVLVARRLGIPFCTVAINKSCYYKKFGYAYFSWEKNWLRPSLITWPRDQITADNLIQYGLSQVHYVGNPMMDFDRSAPQPLWGPEFGPRICLLPGSYLHLPLYIEDMLQVIDEIEICSPPGTARQYLMAAPSFVDFGLLKKVKSEWALQPVDSPGSAARFIGKNATVTVYRKYFGHILENSDLVLGLAGTANEQAAGCGKPIVSFLTRKPHYNPTFASAQEELLGEALCFAPRLQQAAREVVDILNTPERYQRMSRAGRERMGNPGASLKIAEMIRAVLFSNSCYVSAG